MQNRLPSGSPSLLRRLNSAAVLHAIRTSGPISRTELSRVAGLSKPTVNDVVEALLGTGYVDESVPDRVPSGRGPAARPGRRARLLRFRANAGHVLGIDIGANKILAVVTDLDGRVIAAERVRTSAQERADAGALVARVHTVAQAALQAGGIASAALKAVGVGTPGVVDPDSGAVSLAPQLPGWEGVPVRERLADLFPCQILVDNEVHLSLLAESRLGVARGVEDVLYVQIGVGIGGGILIGGNLYRGASGAAGEVGYLPVFDSGASEDHLGAFEQAAGGAAFARLGHERAETHPDSALYRLVNGDLDAIDAETVFTAAGSGDEAAIGVVDELVARLARGVAAAVVVLNPTMVIVGGGVSRAGDLLLRPLEQQVHALVPVPPQIVLSTLGDEAVALGGARLALNVVEEQLFTLTTQESA